jgi:hydroxyethylthiazole kinase-like uncharacterized protein yjeF
MLKIVTSNQMRNMDRYTIEELGIPGVVLMENAGAATFRVIKKMLEEIADPLVYILCGKGNNGGDGFVIARHLWDIQVKVEIFIVGNLSELKGDALVNFNVDKKLGIPYRFIDTIGKFEKVFKDDPDLIVDALLGTGIQGAVRGLFKKIICKINDLGRPVISVDIPSGLDADSPMVEGEAVKADITVTMALPKRCHVFHPAKSFVGELFIADIGIPHTIRQSQEIKVQMIEKSDISLPSRPDDVHKYNCGKVAILAGSPGYTGAAVLTSQAAIRSGAGLVILAIPEKLNPILEAKLTEVITQPYSTGEYEYLNSGSLSQLETLLDWCDVLAIGPGLGRQDYTQKAIIKLLGDFSKPAVIDADALFALGNHIEDIFKQPHGNWILTPHHGEFIRFIKNTSKAEFKHHLLDISGQFAEEYKINLLLKGAPSLVAAPDGHIYINPTGNSGLASGGTGDVLTGVTSSLLAQGLPPLEAAYASNYLHGLCADEVIKTGSKMSLIAGDLIDQLPIVLKTFYCG